MITSAAIFTAWWLNCDLETAGGLTARHAHRIASVQPYVARAANDEGIDPNLINGVIWVESRFNQNAVSSAGAQGLMQLMPSTGRAMFKSLGMPVDSNRLDPAISIAGGAHLLGKLFRRFATEDEAIAAYFAGSGNVSKHGVTARWMDYVDAVKQAREKFRLMRLSCEGSTSVVPGATPRPRPKPRPQSNQRPPQQRPSPSPTVAPTSPQSSGIGVILLLLAYLVGSK